MAEIVVVGSLNMDLVVQTEHLPAPGETIAGGDLVTIPGGKGANQAAAAARLSGKVAMIGRVGNDVFGSRLIDNLHSLGIDHSFVVLDPDASTGTAIIVVDRCGENHIVISAGANGKVSFEDLEASKKLISSAKYMLLQFEVPLKTVEYAANLAAQFGVRVILNPAPARLVSPQLLQKVDILVLNETETKLLTGLDVIDLPTAEFAGRRLQSDGARIVIITLGEKGAVLLSRDSSILVAARKVDVVDTTAAGDAFIGGLATALVRGFDLEQAVHFAVYAGTLAVTRFGAQTSLPTLDEVESFYKEEINKN